MYNHGIIAYYDKHSITAAFRPKDLRRSMVVR